jgi:membrane-bound ClpP family serine protease
MGNMTMKYIVSFSCGFGESFEREFTVEAEAIKEAKKLDKNRAYASEVFEIVLKPVERRIAKFGNVI